jgi:4-aminobutyrate aminotransferase/(S)-3-amino-2-methylpropionate transaminase
VQTGFARTGSWFASDDEGIVPDLMTLAKGIAAGQVVLAHLADGCDGRARRIEELVMPRLRALADATGVIGDVRGRGAMLAIEFVRPGTTEPDADITKRVASAALEAGVIILTCGTYGNVIRLLPSLVIDDALLLDGLGVLEDAVRSATR